MCADPGARNCNSRDLGDEVIEPNELEIIGSWEMKDGRMDGDAGCKRVEALVANYLELVAVSASGWEKLYRDPKDSRYWEWTHLQSEMHGGGPASLRVISPEAAKEKYHATKK